MEISFKTSKHQKICIDYRVAVKELGKKSAEKLFARLAELEVAENLAEVDYIPPARCHLLTGNRKGQFGIDLEHPYRIIFKPDHEPVPLKEDGGIDRVNVTAIKIIEVGEDYHGKKK